MAAPTKQSGTNPIENAYQATGVTQAVTINAGSNRILLVECAMEGDGGGGQSMTSLTYGGQALTRHAFTVASNWSRSEVWYLLEAGIAAASNTNLVVVNTNDQVTLQILRYDGVDQTNPFRVAQTQNSNGTPTSASLTVASVTADDVVRDIITVDGTGHTPFVAGADQTAENTRIGAGGGMTSWSSFQAGSAGGVMSVTWSSGAPMSHVAYALRGIASGTEYTDSATVTVVLTPSAVELQAKDYSDVGTVYVDLQLSSVEARDVADASTVPVALTPSSVELREYTDANTVYVDLQPSAVEIREFVDANTVYIDLQNSGTEFITRETLDAATIPVAITPSSTELRERVDASTVPVAITPSSVETREFTDANAIYVDVTPSATEFISSGYEDSATVAYKLTPSSTEVRDSLDTATVYYDLQPSGVDIYDNGQNEDTGTVYVKITPIRVQEHVLEFDTLLVGTLSSSYTGALVGQSYSGSLNTKRFDGSLLDRLWSAVLNDRKWSGILGRM